MSKIVFLNEPEVVYDGTFSQIGKNQVRLVFTSTIPSNETLMSGFNLVNEHNGRPQTKRTDYTYIYRTYTDNPNMVELCNDNISYVEPEIITTVRFNAGFGGTLEGETSQTAKNYEELVIPTPVADEHYQFVAWNPEISTSGEIEKDITFTAQFEYVETLEEVRASKIQEFNYICNQMIEEGQDIELEDGSIVSFKYTEQNRVKIKSAADLAISTKEAVILYDDNNNSTVYLPNDIIKIYTSCDYYIVSLHSLNDQLHDMINLMEDKDLIKSLTFSEESLDEEHKKNYDELLLQEEKILEKYAIVESSIVLKEQITALEVQISSLEEQNEVLTNYVLDMSEAISKGVNEV